MKGEKTGGRQKGTPNKANKDLREWLSSFIEKSREQIEKDWQNLEPKDRIVLFEKLLKYTLPQLQAVSSKVNFEDMTEQQLDYIINELRKTE